MYSSKVGMTLVGDPAFIVQDRPNRTTVFLVDPVQNVRSPPVATKDRWFKAKAEPSVTAKKASKV